MVEEKEPALEEKTARLTILEEPQGWSANRGAYEKDKCGYDKALGNSLGSFGGRFGAACR